MLNFLKSLFKEGDSGLTAKNRLKVVIAQDRVALPPDVMDNLKKDLMDVFRKYFEIEEQGIEFNMGKDSKLMGLSISIPIKDVKDAKEKKRYNSSTKAWN